MFCSQCGTKNADEAKFCQNCGAPLTVIAAPAVPSAPAVIQYAGFWRRFAAFIIDRLILAIPNGILVALFGLQVFTLFGIGEQGLEFNFDKLGTVIAAAIWLALAVFLVRLFYYALFESSRLQATPGKMALGIIVTDLDHKQVTLARALGRNLGKILSGLIFCIGYIMAGLTAKKQALHDMMAECLVVMR